MRISINDAQAEKFGAKIRREIELSMREMILCFEINL
jgi:hypothetical protein